MRRILLLLLLCAVPSFADEAARPEIRGVWIHTYEPWDWDAVMPKIAAAGFNCVFVRVARGVNAIYPSQFLPRDGWAEKNAANVPDELAKAIAAAHRSGLQFHAWKVNFNATAGMMAGDGPKALTEKMAADDRLVRDPDGKQAASLNPADPRNQQLELDVMTEIATKYPVDGIHFDYIRYPEVPSYDFDYGPVSRREFEAKLGRAVANWPRDVISGEDKIAYEDWERGNVNSVVQRVHDAMSAVATIKNYKVKPKKVIIASSDGTGAVAAVAAAAMKNDIDGAVIDTQGFRFAKLTDVQDVNFVPGAVKYGDLPAVLRLSDKAKLTVLGEGAPGGAEAVADAVLAK